jgi:hypothetical protein
MLKSNLNKKISSKKIIIIIIIIIKIQKQAIKSILNKKEIWGRRIRDERLDAMERHSGDAAGSFPET